MKINQKKILKNLLIESVESSNKTLKSQRLYIKNSINKIQEDKTKFKDFKLKDNSEDILTSFKTKTNLFNTNTYCKECTSLISLDDNSSINYFKIDSENKSNISEYLNDNNNLFSINEYDGDSNFYIENENNGDSILKYLDIEEPQTKTVKIDYKYYSNFPNIKYIYEYFEKNHISKDSYCWLATYDKLMKRKKLIKILKFYGNTLDESKIIEKCIKIENFELFYNSNYDKPLIKPGKNFILVKLYLLNNDQLNIIFNYLNRVNTKLNINEINNYRNNDFYKGKYNILFSHHKHYPYPLLYCLGNYMNVNIFSFSNYSNNIDLNNINNNININEIKSKNIPSTKKIAKLIKLLMLNFTNDKTYNLNFFIFYTIANLKFINFNKIYFEIKEIINSYNINNKIKNNNSNNINKSENKNININKILKDKILSLDIDDNDCNNSIFNSNNSKMIKTDLNNILTDSSFISNNLSNSFNEKNQKSKQNNKKMLLNKSIIINEPFDKKGKIEIIKDLKNKFKTNYNSNKKSNNFTKKVKSKMNFSKQ